MHECIYVQRSSLACLRRAHETAAAAFAPSMFGGPSRVSLTETCKEIALNNIANLDEVFLCMQV